MAARDKVGEDRVARAGVDDDMGGGGQGRLGGVNGAQQPKAMSTGLKKRQHVSDWRKRIKEKK